MNVCGNWRGRANSSAVPCHSQSHPCVSSSRRVTCLISRQSWDARETSLTTLSPFSFCWFKCFKGSGGFSFNVWCHKTLSVPIYSCKMVCFSVSALPPLDYITILSLSLSHILFLSLSPSLPLSLPLNPSASCRSVRLPVSVPIRFHLIHVTSINTQSSPDKSRPLSPPLCLSCVALHHSVFPNKLSSPQSSVTMYKITRWLHEQVNLANVLDGWRSTAETGALHQPTNQRLCLTARLASAPSYVNFLLCFQQTLVGALLTPEDEGVLITSLVKKLQKTPWAFSTLREAV